jgi:hypothetical protein
MPLNALHFRRSKSEIKRKKGFEMAQLEIKKSEKELLDNRQYWWWAEKKRSPRLNYLRKAIKGD